MRDHNRTLHGDEANQIYLRLKQIFDLPSLSIVRYVAIHNLSSQLAAMGNVIFYFDTNYEKRVCVKFINGEVHKQNCSITALLDITQPRSVMGSSIGDIGRRRVKLLDLLLCNGKLSSEDEAIFLEIIQNENQRDRSSVVHDCRSKT